MGRRKTSQETTIKIEVRDDDGSSRRSGRGLGEVESGVRNQR